MWKRELGIIDYLDILDKDSTESLTACNVCTTLEFEVVQTWIHKVGTLENFHSKTHLGVLETNKAHYDQTASLKNECFFWNPTETEPPSSIELPKGKSKLVL